MKIPLPKTTSELLWRFAILWLSGFFMGWEVCYLMLVRPFLHSP